ncbi:unnamed protein product [Gongylonema pulchrum]|uniref:Uncharacterized protein n=1 Tax=Gongylonema pulchrum TaxID=637853 RepID=A0A183E4Y3_9BILA|nr:unnamed protein product [Gongylonema pulchrum]
MEKVNNNITTISTNSNNSQNNGNSNNGATANGNNGNSNTTEKSSNQSDQLSGGWERVSEELSDSQVHSKILWPVHTGQLS